MNTESKPIIIDIQGRLIRYLCPKCKHPIGFRKKYLGRSLCFRCGQRLDWSPSNDIFTETIDAVDSDEAAWIADCYYTIRKTPNSERLDTDDWRKSLKGKGVELYLIFKDRKEYGRFMRLRSKNNN